MTSWSYQSTNPCTVLVNENKDGSISRNCPPPVLQSSTETAAASQDQPEIISSLGNSVGGKKARSKRDTHGDGFVGVVFDNGDGHEDDEPHFEPVEKRILVNISIAMDQGLGTSHLKVYQLQVAVPLPKEKPETRKFYAYDTERFMAVNGTTARFDDPETSPSTDPIDDDESSTTSFDEFITLSSSSSRPEGLETNLNESGMQLMDHDYAKTSRELIAPRAATPNTNIN